MRPALTVVAFGGNAMLRRGERGTPEQQIRNARAACRPLAELVAAGRRLLLVHGNGPQVGLELERGHRAREVVAPLPLDSCVAATQGIMGYWLELALREELRRLAVAVPIATLATVVRVEADDPAFAAPDKPIGPFLDRDAAARLARERGVTLVEDAGRGYRQVVPSPLPAEVLDAGVVEAALDAGHLVIAGGGGGIPVVRGPEGELVGVEAVIDKDHTASLLGRQLGARELLDLTAVDFVYRDFGTPAAIPLRHLSAREARRLAAEGQFPPGSMGPKVEAALAFLEGGGESVLVSSMEHLEAALRGEIGTRLER